ncbi:hypothetical protein BaRGS_00009826 [Batillaria attramentaria]|uniref:ERAP1-like C-terminal domain-containing protein n=1 Tax=Batillaria attramentaria TaxID=370345 RepID=A0ABD0LJ52_9CAEN
MACESGLPECVQQAVQLFQQWRAHPDTNPISPALRQYMYCTAVREGSESDWFFVLTRYRQETSPGEKNLLLRALPCSSDVWILSTLLDMSLEHTDIKRDDATGMIGWVAKNPAGNRLAWDFVKHHWDVIIRHFAQSPSRLKTMLRAFIAAQTELGIGEQTLRQAVETVEFNIKWYKDSYPQLVQWLQDKGYFEFQGAETTST